MTLMFIDFFSNKAVTFVYIKCDIFQDMLLIKATTSATLQCLGQCLTMLQQRQVN